MARSGPDQRAIASLPVPSGAGRGAPTSRGDLRAHHAGQGDDECGPEALTVGAIVEEAELKISSAGREWREIELR